MTEDPAYPPPLIGALLRVPVDEITERLVAALRAHGYADVVPAHFAVLRHPGPMGRRPSELAADANMSRQAMNYLLGQLESLGYVERRDGEDGERGRSVHLTDRGRELIPILRDAVREVEDEWAAVLGREELETLRAILERLRAHVVQARGARGAAR
jgi:DNA-binding MarR family transcriptional regulator